MNFASPVQVQVPVLQMGQLVGWSDVFFSSCSGIRTSVLWVINPRLYQLNHQGTHTHTHTHTQRCSYCYTHFFLFLNNFFIRYDTLVTVDRQTDKMTFLILHLCVDRVTVRVYSLNRWFWRTGKRRFPVVTSTVNIQPR